MTYYIDLDWIISIDPGTGEVVMGGGQYPIKNLSFSPQVDLTGNSMPINQYTCDVITADEIPVDCVGHRLRDARGLSWAEWPLTHVQRIAANCWRVTASSWLWGLQYTELEAKMYTTETAAEAVAECFPEYSSDYSLAEDLQDIPIRGFCPAQTARERLTWLLFVIGAYADDTFTDRVEIKAVDDTPALIPLEYTFMRPAEDTRDWVTGLSVTAYTFRQGTEAEWQADENSFQFPVPWIATPQKFDLTNPDAPGDARENIIEWDALYLVNLDNVSGILTRLAKYWFNPKEVQLDCVNNHSYKPGDLVQAYTDTDRMVMGYVQQMNSRFGLQSRSTLKLIGATAVTGAKLTVRYTYQSGIIGKAVYFLPVGHAFSIDNPYLDKTKGMRRRIYRPTTAKAEGTMVDGGMTVNVNYEIALELYQGVLHVISVDEINEQSSGGEYIGVIS